MSLFYSKLWWAILLSTLCSGAFAYVDPGSGQLAWQLLLAAFLGVTYHARKIFVHARAISKKLVGLITGK